jgi:thioredoxin reductase (NADPH)
LVGGGNSAGQAAVFLSAHAKKVWMLVRSTGLAASMSRYLIDRISAAPNVELLTETEIIDLIGTEEAGLRGVRWRHRRSGDEAEHALSHVFLFVGADPETAWLANCGVELDAQGFVKTGSHVSGSPILPSGRVRARLETSVPGVFAIGDVRAESVKRVGAAIGEGAAVVAQVHGYLSQVSAQMEEAVPAH